MLQNFGSNYHASFIFASILQYQGKCFIFKKKHFNIWCLMAVIIFWNKMVSMCSNLGWYLVTYTLVLLLCHAFKYTHTHAHIYIRLLMHMFILYQDLHTMTKEKGVILVLHGASGLSGELIKVHLSIQYSSGGNRFCVLKFASQCIPNYTSSVNYLLIREEVGTPKLFGLGICFWATG